MCIAVLKPNGQSMLSKKELRTCWENNPDGAGFSYNDGMTTHTFKGYMKFKPFYKKLMEVAKKVDFSKCDVLLHFRIATHGGINPSCTHPFPVTKRFDEMKQLQFTSDVVFAHNGIIGGYGDDKKHISDTMEYNQKIIASIKELQKQSELINALAIENNSRFALLFKDGYILGGDWIEEDRIFYSNYSYIKYDYTILHHDYFYDKDNFVDGLIDDTCDYCGKNKHLYTNGTLWLCKDCISLENNIAGGDV